MEAILNELKVFGELWKEEIEWQQQQEIEQRLKLYKKYLWAKKKLREEIEWIINSFNTY